jgi:hypothetical protein
MRTKTVSETTLHNLFEALEQDAIIFQQSQPVSSMTKSKTQRLEMHGLQDLINDSDYREQPTSGIVNLRFEDCQFSSKAVSVLKSFLSKKNLIETLVASKVEFQSPMVDFKEFVGGIQSNKKLRKVGFTAMYFDEE